MTGRDNAADRKVGARWEQEFCRLGMRFGKVLTPHQLVAHKGAAVAYGPSGERISTYLLPDITVWSNGGEHHEVKHKNPTRRGRYGLEVYRFKKLLTWARVVAPTPVFYTIHDWQRAGASSGRDEMENRVEDWVTVNVLHLPENGDSRQGNGSSYIGGTFRAGDVSILYWDVGRFSSLAQMWLPPVTAEVNARGA